MKITVTGKTLNVEQITALLVEGENDADRIEIELPEWHGALGLTGLNYSIAGYTNKETRVEDTLYKRIVNNRVLLLWIVTSKWTAVSASMDLELVGATETGIKIKWQSPHPIKIRPTLGTGPLPPPDIMQQYLASVQGLVLQAAGHATRAEDAADRAEDAAQKSEAVLGDAKRYTDQQVNAVLGDAKRYTDQQVNAVLTEHIYTVPYFDPTDGNKRPLQDVLDRMYSQRIGAYTWNELEEKNLTCAEFEALGLTCNDITKGGW